MNQTVIFFGIVIALITAWLIGFVQSLDEEVDVSYGFNEQRIVEGYDPSYDSLGNEVLNIEGKLSLKQKEAKWNSSALKQEMLKEFPKFSYMKEFVKLHISDEDMEFKEKILAHIDEVEMDFVSSQINADQAKAAL